MAPGRGVGAVTLDIGGVIYVSPRLRERNLDKEEFLKHETSHAIVTANVTLWRLQEVKHHTWIYEGVPVWFARQRSYAQAGEFLDWVRRTDIHPVMSFDAQRGGASVEMRFAYVLWRNFIQYLAARHGSETFKLFYRGYLARPHALDSLFEQAFGRPLAAYVDEFQSSLRRGDYVPPE